MSAVMYVVLKAQKFPSLDGIGSPPNINFADVEECLYLPLDT
jgi:hypothetical protein